MKERTMSKKRLAEAAAMLIVGDAVLSVVDPVRHVRLWTCGPRWCRRLGEGLAKRPNRMRSLGLAGVTLGAYWASHQERARSRRLLPF